MRGQRIFQTEYAGHTVRYRFLSPGTRIWFGSWAHLAEGDSFDVSVTPTRLAMARNMMEKEMARRSLPVFDLSDPYVEFRTLTELSSHPLLPHGCCFFHAASFLWQKRAWLLTGPSGVGKSTQYLNWKRCFPGEITVICGDMPLLEQRTDGSVWCHPSPWNGKERLGSKTSPFAPLGGVVFLEQGAANDIAPLPVRDAILALFRQFILIPDTEDEILKLASLADSMLRSVPVWKLTNRGDEASTALLRQVLKGDRHDPL